MKEHRPHQPSNADLETAFDKHAHEDKLFQDETRMFNGEMATFQAETEGSLSDLHQKMDLMLKKFDPSEKTYAFGNMDKMFEIYKGFGFSNKAILVAAGIIGSLAVIIGSLFTAVRYLKSWN